LKPAAEAADFCFWNGNDKTKEDNFGYFPAFLNGNSSYEQEW